MSSHGSASTRQEARKKTRRLRCKKMTPADRGGFLFAEQVGDLRAAIESIDKKRDDGVVTHMTMVNRPIITERGRARAPPRPSAGEAPSGPKGAARSPASGTRPR